MRPSDTPFPVLSNETYRAYRARKINEESPA